MKEYLYLAVAITAEIGGTTALKLTDGFTNVIPSTIVVVGYIGSFYFLSLTLEELPIGLVYATWSGVGIIGAAGIGIVMFEETIDLMAIVGISLIILGVVILNAFSQAYTPS
ncbi:DMT family transporter [Haladaptatus cibarius]|uniref:DMT family transporter n=1 Tax=Haladaptatus cibarius TaxID=453847 RepID=UPI0006794278|nr:multidrug efflux SMR transporter [Haladaptatus cibarius]